MRPRFLSMLIPTVAIGFVACTALMRAQPADAQVIKDISGSRTISVSLAPNGGTRQFNSDLGAYEWVRGALCTLKTNDPDVQLLVRGDAVYNLIGTTATFRKFRVISNEYLGIPNPTADEIMALIRADPPKFFGSVYNNVVGDINRLEVSADTGWTWHNPNSVELSMFAEFNAVSNNTTVDSVRQDYRLRLYRDSVQQSWKRFDSTPRDRTVYSRAVFTAAEVRGFLAARRTRTGR